MARIWQPIKEIGLFLLGVVTIVAGLKANETPSTVKAEPKEEAAPAQAKTEAGGTAASAASEQSSRPRKTRKKTKTVLEKVAPEKASATQYQQPASK